MIEALPPGLVLILGAVLIPLVHKRLQPAVAAVLPLLGFAQILMLEPGVSHQLTLFDYELTVVRVDRLSLVFGYIFCLAAFLSAVYALHVKDTVQHVAAMIYVGSAVGAVFAGDLITLFVYWEITAVSSVFLIWASRTEAAYRSGLRYLVIQVGSGVLLLAGVIVHASASGSIAFTKLIGEDGLLSTASPGVVLIFRALRCWREKLRTLLISRLSRTLSDTTTSR
jgi:multicomponent Na+:H+ antiporter subunit D